MVTSYIGALSYSPLMQKRKCRAVRPSACDYIEIIK